MSHREQSSQNHTSIGKEETFLLEVARDFRCYHDDCHRLRRGQRYLPLKELKWKIEEKNQNQHNFSIQRDFCKSLTFSSLSFLNRWTFQIESSELDNSYPSVFDVHA